MPIPVSVNSRILTLRRGFLLLRRPRGQGPHALHGEPIRDASPLLPVLDRAAGFMPAGGKGRGVLPEGGTEGFYFLSNRHGFLELTA